MGQQTPNVPMSSPGELTSLLSEVDRALASYARSQDERAATVAAGFNVFAYIRPDENRLSRILADLLDPRGPHGQRELFLKLFLSAAGLDVPDDVVSARVSCEYMTDPVPSARRIDILVKGKEWSVAIENKPWAQDGLLQVQSYLDWLRSQTPSGCHLVYLSKDRRRPSSRSISPEECDTAIANRQLVLMSYVELSQWLEKCCTACRAERVTWFLKAYQDYIHERLFGELPAEAQQMIVDTILDAANSQYLRAALELIQTREAIRSRLLTLLMQQLRSQLPAGWRVCRSLPDEGGIGLQPPGAQGWHFGIESNEQGWWYGIKCNADATPEQRQHLRRQGENVVHRLRWKDRTAQWWPIWRWFEGHGTHDLLEYRNWETNTRPWIDMRSGAMARNLIALALEMREIFES